MLSQVGLFATPWTVARQVSLSSLSESGVAGADLRGRGGEARGGGANKSTSWEGILCGAGGGEGSVRSVKGFKLERGAKGSV